MRPIRTARAFTLIELLMVIAIIGLLAALGLPALKGLTSSNKSAGATRQLADDLKFARSKAISERTTVYVVFVPPDFSNLTLGYPVGYANTPADDALKNRDTRLIEKLLNQKLTSYALFAERRVGDQPGRPSSKYITSWRSLPDGSFIAEREFKRLPSAAAWKSLPIESRPLPYGQFPFPSDTVDCPSFDLPYIAFNHLGQLVVPFYKVENGPLQQMTGNPDDLVVHLAQGSILYGRDANGDLHNEANNPPPIPPDIVETPPGNSSNLWVRVNWLTGRAEIDQPQIVD